jgi:hypothetical protein
VTTPTGSAAAAFIIAWLIKHGWSLPDDVNAQINVYVFLAVMAAYNVVVNWLTVHVAPWFGYLLIVPKTPVYGDKRALLAPEVPTEGNPPARRFYGGSDPQSHEGVDPEAGQVLYYLLVAIAVVVLVILIFALAAHSGGK